MIEVGKYSVKKKFFNLFEYRDSNSTSLLNI